MHMGNYTWEQAVQWLRDQPDQDWLVRACYYDDPLLQAAERFANSDEWLAVRDFLPQPPGLALDLGAGRGISSYALARDGWQVTALEPDRSPVVGSGAIRALAAEANLSISIIEEYGETLHFDNDTFDLVYGRQVLHHARNLPKLCQEAARVLRPGGCFVATREHVISKPDDLDAFLRSHPLHHLYGGEHAYLLGEYRSAITHSGMSLVKILAPFESVINYFPMTREEWHAACSRPLAWIVGERIARMLTSERHVFGRWLLSRLASWRARWSHEPGRLYSFVAERPRT
jgi:SAM-dependent methyltransferase